ncbi:hypothetical protein FSP39_018881 [Pinctada imbricata]|uniref:Uncharacterized protein n=1 Tax=Pinctada imbricata TaxID=66713 RepID=A0AA88YDM4_PINIB|nr:hypothetical protein FSP39_018881 [Pinctada imbricata]
MFSCLAVELQEGFIGLSVSKNNLFLLKIVHSLFILSGLSMSQAIQYLRVIQGQVVQYLLPPTWTRCGRPKNAYIVMPDGKSMCVRYRDPHIKLVLGEVLSFYLSRFLGMDNVPVAALSRASPETRQWRNQAVNMTQMHWQNGKVVALIQWIPNLDSYSSFARIPSLLLNAYQSNQSLTSMSLRSLTISKSDLIDLIQWGSMIIFDYLTGHYDRFASMQDGAYEQKNQKILLDNIRNLRKSKNSKLWLIDNESGLLDAYDLLYNDSLGGYKFRKFHADMLRTMCVFQKPVVDAIKTLHASEEPHVQLNEFAFRYDSLLQTLWSKSLFNLYEKKFKERVNDIYEWIKYCEIRNKR